MSCFYKFFSVFPEEGSIATGEYLLYNKLSFTVRKNEQDYPAELLSAD